MPKIIARPAQTRNVANAVSDTDLDAYVTLMLECEGTDQIVTVDDSERQGYEAAYARGERIRIALKKRAGLTFKVQVVSYKVDETDTRDRTEATYAAGIRIKK